MRCVHTVKAIAFVTSNEVSVRLMLRVAKTYSDMSSG